MIERLYVKNVALIEEIEMDFSNGLNILSGETGAGKSMIIDSINFLLGERADKDFVRSGAEDALVEGFLVVHQEEVLADVRAMGIQVEDDAALLISRTINRSGKGSIRINGKSATVGMLREIAALFVDIHSQHEHQSLLKPSKHIELLDKFAHEQMVQNKHALSGLIKEFREIEEKIESLSGLEQDGSSKLDFLKFQIDEIAEAGLKPGEEEDLTARRKVLLSTEKLMEGCRKVLELLYDGEDGGNALDQVAEAMEIAVQIGDTDPTQTELGSRLGEVSALLDDIVRDTRRYGETLEHDPEQLAEVENRLELIYNLKRKYGSSVELIGQRLGKFKEEYDFLVNSKEILEEYSLKREKLLKEIWKICGRISKYRKSCGKEIQKNIESNLKELGMKDARFEIQITPKEQFTANGSDQVEFMISPNAGEPLKPLAKIASGGEMSRVMLALKTVLADGDTVETFIFDEIDTGVSGRTAQKVAEKLSIIAKKQQILCITHLPQIAAMADSHFLIEKASDKKSTVTTVVCLDEKAIIQELARLIGGAEITEATLTAATEIKNMADSLK